jgi:hypothetical protein
MSEPQNYCKRPTVDAAGPTDAGPRATYHSDSDLLAVDLGNEDVAWRRQTRKGTKCQTTGVSRKNATLAVDVVRTPTHTTASLRGFVPACKSQGDTTDTVFIITDCWSVLSVVTDSSGGPVGIIFGRQHSHDKGETTMLW